VSGFESQSLPSGPQLFHIDKLDHLLATVRDNADEPDIDGQLEQRSSKHDDGLKVLCPLELEKCGDVGDAAQVYPDEALLSSRRRQQSIDHTANFNPVKLVDALHDRETPFGRLSDIEGYGSGHASFSLEIASRHN
jgi:hypothetical protein